MDVNVGTALLFTSAAGLSTTIGSLLGIALKKPSARFTSFTLGFAAGVMIYVSFVELLPRAIESSSFLIGNAAFLGGIALMFLIDAAVPHEYMAEHYGRENKGLLRTGLLVALGLGIHNFPEGIATFAATLKDVKLGLAIAVAIAIHNIPEGLAVAAPIYAATGSRKKAFGYSFLSGVAEPLGAGVAALVLYPFLTDSVLGLMLGVVAGLMVYISLDELVPASREYGYEHTAIMGTAVGMAVMSLSLLLVG